MCLCVRQRSNKGCKTAGICGTETRRGRWRPTGSCGRSAWAATLPHAGCREHVLPRYAPRAWGTCPALTCAQGPTMRMSRCHERAHLQLAKGLGLLVLIAATSTGLELPGGAQRAGCILHLADSKSAASVASHALHVKTPCPTTLTAIPADEPPAVVLARQVVVELFSTSRGRRAVRYTVTGDARRTAVHMGAAGAVLRGGHWCLAGPAEPCSEPDARCSARWQCACVLCSSRASRGPWTTSARFERASKTLGFSALEGTGGTRGPGILGLEFHERRRTSGPPGAHCQLL